MFTAINTIVKTYWFRNAVDLPSLIPLITMNAATKPYFYNNNLVAVAHIDCIMCKYWMGAWMHFVYYEPPKWSQPEPHIQTNLYSGKRKRKAILRCIFAVYIPSSQMEQQSEKFYGRFMSATKHRRMCDWCGVAACRSLYDDDIILKGLQLTNTHILTHYMDTIT